MIPIEWTPDLETGNARIDNDHRALIDHVNLVLSAISNGRSSGLISGTLAELRIYTRGHFSREEDEMERIGYAGAAMHIAEHQSLLLQVDLLKERFDSGQKIDALYLFNFLSQWLRHHILQVDMKLAAALRQF